MSSHLLDPLRKLARAIRAAMTPAPAPDPLAFLHGADVPEHLVGRHLKVVAADGRILASTRRQHSEQALAMIG